MSQAEEIPAIIGAHMCAPGFIFGLNFAFAWAVYSGHASWPFERAQAAWLPGAIIYSIVVTVISLRQPAIKLGPGALSFVAVWSGACATLIGTAISMIIVQRLIGKTIHDVLPAIGFMVVGAAWLTLALMWRQGLFFLYATLSFAAGIGGALAVNRPESWLLYAVGLLFCIALPGAGLVFNAARVRLET